MSVRAQIETKLKAALAPARLEVVDESELHKGHAGHRPGGESHFRVEIAAAAFEG
ncbi:MAG TPA: BolA family protein, partial [Dongiaceae bacterium]|nr:BolA family protein [Dongiaceae bacterium]